MARKIWSGISGKSLDETDRSEFKPYGGPIPPNELFCFKINALKHGKSSKGTSQLIIGLTLVPRASRPEDKRYADYRIMDYIPVMESTQWRLVPFLDAIGVSGDDFEKRTMDSGEKDRWGSVPITKIGRWINDGKQYVMALLRDGEDQNGKTRKEIGGYWMPGAASEDPAEEDADAAEEDAPF
jgi:hypothetical protein